MWFSADEITEMHPRREAARPNCHSELARLPFTILQYVKGEAFRGRSEAAQQIFVFVTFKPSTSTGPGDSEATKTGGRNRNSL
jgi:hypothetical protein